MTDMLTKRGIVQFTTDSHSRTKAALAERGVGQIKRRLVKMRHHARKPGRPNLRWTDLLESAVLNYNLSPHSSLGGYPPSFARRPENTDLILAIQNSRMRPRFLNNKYLRRGTKVRVRSKPGSFGMRIDQDQNSQEIFIVSRVFAGNQVHKSLEML